MSVLDQHRDAVLQITREVATVIPHENLELFQSGVSLDQAGDRTLAAIHDKVSSHRRGIGEPPITLDQLRQYSVRRFYIEGVQHVIVGKAVKILGVLEQENEESGTIQVVRGAQGKHKQIQTPLMPDGYPGFALRQQKNPVFNDETGLFEFENSTDVLDDLVKHSFGQLVEVLGYARLEDGTPVVLLELIEEPNLADQLEPVAPYLPVHLALNIIRQKIMTLEALHQGDLRYGDCRHDNIAVDRKSLENDPNTKARFLDIGCIVRHSQYADHIRRYFLQRIATVVRGTPLSLPPEAFQLDGRVSRIDDTTLSVRGEVYGVTDLFRKLLCGQYTMQTITGKRHPTPYHVISALGSRTRKLPSISISISSKLSKVLEWGLDPDVEERADLIAFKLALADTPEFQEAELSFESAEAVAA